MSLSSICQGVNLPTACSCQQEAQNDLHRHTHMLKESNTDSELHTHQSFICPWLAQVQHYLFHSLIIEVNIQSCPAPLWVINMGKWNYWNKFCECTVRNTQMKKCYWTFCKHMLYLTAVPTHIPRSRVPTNACSQRTKGFLVFVSAIAPSTSSAVSRLSVCSYFPPACWRKIYKNVFNSLLFHGLAESLLLRAL